MNVKTIYAADLFCGAGGLTTGLVRTCKKLGVKLDILALNHWEIAVATHKANHPDLRHICERIDSVDPREAVPGGHLDMLMAAPECVYFSIARGGKPCSDQSRATAWHVLRWCDALEVDNVLIENVREFKNWGPLGVSGMPLKSRRGETYRAFLSALRSLNYRVEEQMLNAADFGGATTRERLFILARRGNKTIHWPKRTHAPPEKTNCLDGRLKPWRTAREIIDWSLIGKSIFARKKPLSPNTLRRIAAGIKKFCGIDLEPFFVMMYGTGKVRSIERPLPTVTAKQHIALCKPFLVSYFGEREGQPPRVHNVSEPLPTVTSHGAGALVEPFLIPQQSGGSPRHVSHPVPTIATAGAIALCEPWILPNEGYYRGNKPRSVDKPLPTITAGRGGGRVVMPFIVEINHDGSKNGNPAIRAHSIDDPLPTVEPYIVEYYGHGKAKSVRKPLPTVTTHDRFALVEPTPVTNGDQRLYLDIRLRMLAPHELSAAMGFPPSYRFAGTKTEIVKQIGNAVQVDLAEKLTYAILSHHLKTTGDK